jgi:nitrite reductase (NO-forming)
MMIAASLLFMPFLYTSAAEAGLFGIGSSFNLEEHIDSLQRIEQTLVPPPNLPDHKHIAYGTKPRVIAITMKIVEKELEIAEDVYVRAMTFEGTNPGPIMVAHQGDYVVLTLQNPSTNTMLHNIDLHASTGAMGGGTLTEVSPGEEAVLRFKATKSGVFVYHCAPGGTMIPYHVVSGMNGVIMVLPRDGLQDLKGHYLHYDKAYYIGEQDWYVPRDPEGNFLRYNSPQEAMGATFKVMKTLIPTHLTFNGSVGALTGENSLKANVGDRVLFIHSQANRDSRVHLIGGHGDLVWRGGSFADMPASDLQTWAVAGGEAVAAYYTFRQPGVYAYVNHNLIESVIFGALAIVEVQGDWNVNLMKQVSAAKPI